MNPKRTSCKMFSIMLVDACQALLKRPAAANAAKPEKKQKKPESNVSVPFPYRKLNTWAIKVNGKQVMSEPRLCYLLLRFGFFAGHCKACIILDGPKVGAKNFPFEKAKEIIATP